MEVWSEEVLLPGRKEVCSQMKKEDNTWKVSTGVQIKSERDLTPKAIGGKSESIRCYKCGELGHIKRNCPKVTIKRIKKRSNEGWRARLQGRQ